MGYPNRKVMLTPAVKAQDNHMGRGMSLENDLNDSNAYYCSYDRASIHEKPTPIQAVKVDCPERNAVRVTEAYYKAPSTTGYNGIYRGGAIDFEAKETRQETLLPFKNIHSHQIEHLKKVIQHGGIGFFIIRFTCFEEAYLVDAAILIGMYYERKRKSISYMKVKEVGSLTRMGPIPGLCYPDNIDALYFKEEKSYGIRSKRGNGWCECTTAATRSKGYLRNSR